MLKFLLLIIGLFVLSLNAQPTMSQVISQVKQNPALLETPQAKAMMREKGISVNDVKQKIIYDQNITTKEIASDTANNILDITVDEEVGNDKQKKIQNKEDVNKTSSLSKRVNPFVYKSNDKLRAEVNAKQQVTTTSQLHRYSLSFYADQNKLDSASLPTPDNYIISTGNKIGIHVYGDRDKQYSLVVKNDGTIDLPFIGPLKVGGMSFKDVKKHLTQQLKNNFKTSDFNIIIDKYSTIQTTLIGDVKYPGIYNLSSFSSVKDLLVVAKGVKKNASVREITIKRNSKIVAKLDFYDLLFKGDSLNTILLKQGDVVIIEKAKKLVSIDGYVNNAAIFELKGNENLNTLIDYAGGMKPNASKAEIKISRYANNSKLETFKISYKKSKKFKMKNGDKVYIYPLDFTAQNSINVYGNIIRPGTYNLNHKKTLNEFLKISLKDGIKKFFLPNTYFEYGVIKRYTDALEYSSKSFNLSKVISGDEKINLKANDKIYIFSVNDIYSSAYITTKGSSLVKSGKLQYMSGMTIQDAINASGIDGILDDRVRLTTYSTQDFMPKTTFYSFKKQGDKVKLNPYDEIEVYDYYSTHILEPVSIGGQVVEPITTFYEKGMTLSSLLNIAGGFNKTAYTKSISLVRYFIDEDQTRQQKVLSFDLSKTAMEDIELKPYDEVMISKILGWDAQDYDFVSINGEVHNPVKVKYGKGMKLSDLIVMAGGLTRMAYTKKLEIVRYSIDENQTRQREVITFKLKDKNLSKIALKEFDEVKIFKIPNWSDKKTIVVKGEVAFPGTYSIETGERFSDLLKRAGGFTDAAFVEATVMTRESIRKNQTKNYNATLVKIKRDLAMYNSMPANAKKASAPATTSAITDVLAEAQKYQPIGRISLSLDSNLSIFEKSEFNLVLEDGDTITIPSKIDTVTVFGEVFNATSFIYNSDKSIEDYIEMASGTLRTADRDKIYIIHANGTSEHASSGFFFGSGIDVQKGDTIVVPLYIKEENTLDVWGAISKIMASFALTIAAVNSLGVI